MTLAPIIASPEMVISILRLLLDGYKAVGDRFKDKKTPDRIEKIVVRAEEAEPTTVSKEDIERSIKEELEPGDAAIVKGDLDLFSLLLLPAPVLEAFDYWGKFTRLVTGLHAFAKKNSLFELRGSEEFRFGAVLKLPRTGKCMLPNEYADQLAIPRGMESLKETRCIAMLQKETNTFPVHVGVEARFNVYSVMGGPPGLHMEHCFFQVGPGQQRHWFMFDRGEGFESHFRQRCEYMLQATEFISIVQALRDDIRECATEIQLDEQKITSCFAAIDAFADGFAP